MIKLHFKESVYLCDSRSFYSLTEAVTHISSSTDKKFFHIIIET